MPTLEDQQKINDQITGKLSRVTAYGRTLQFKTFGSKYVGGRNKMAMAVLFTAGYNSLKVYIEENESDWSIVNDCVFLEKLDSLIDLFNAPDCFWERFWKGLHASFKPLNINFIVNNEIKAINMFEIDNIVIENMGIPI